MSFIFLPKTLPLPPAESNSSPEKKGAVSFVFAFMVFLFSIFCLSLIILTHVHFRLSINRRNMVFIEYSTENGIKQGLSSLLGLLQPFSSPQPLSSSEFERLRELALFQGNPFIEEVLGKKFPFYTSETWEGQYWKSEVHLLQERFLENDHYFCSIYEFAIHSEGKIKNFNLKKKAVLTGSTGIFAGFIPLPLFPLIIEKKMSPEEQTYFIEKNSIKLSTGGKSSLFLPAHFPQSPLIPEHQEEAISMAFKVKIFKPQNLSVPELRFFLGLEVNDEPVPEGVYLIQNNLGLGGIYVEGDVEEMIFAIDGSYQVIHIRMNSGRWIIKYSPLERKTLFITPEKELAFDLLLQEILIISGKVNSLTGGKKESSGEITITEEEVPSLLQGTHLTIISSGKISIASHLIHQGLSHKQGVPYLKDFHPGLVLFSTGKKIWNGSEVEGGIEINESSPDELKIQAAVIASGRGFRISGEGKKVILTGSLQASDYFSNKNSLNINYESLPLDLNSTSYYIPLTKEPVLFVSFFSAWRWEKSE